MSAPAGHAGKLEELIYGKHERGLPAGEQVKDGEIRYHMAFWHAPYASEEGCRLYIPMMRGWGGNRVVLMPGELTGIRLAKNLRSAPAHHAGPDQTTQPKLRFLVGRAVGGV